MHDLCREDTKILRFPNILLNITQREQLLNFTQAIILKLKLNKSYEISIAYVQ